MKNLASLKQLFSSFDEAIYIVNRNRKILFFNPAAEKITGFKEHEIVNKNCFDNTLNHVNKDGVNLCTNGCPLLVSIKENKVIEDSIFLHHKNGHRIPIYVKTIPYIEDGIVTGAVEIFSITSKRTSEEKINLVKKYISMIDPLTGLLNRNFLDHKIKDIVSAYSYSLMFIDIDNFKRVNDTYGHLIGDNVLKIVSDTLTLNTRNDDYIVRFGGEEIIIFLKTDNIIDAFNKANELRILISSSEERSVNYKPTVTIGVTMIEKDELISKALERADKAMYIGKNNGKNQVSIL